MDQKGNILANQSVANDPAAVSRVVAPYGTNVHVTIEASTSSVAFAEELITQYTLLDLIPRSNTINSVLHLAILSLPLRPVRRKRAGDKVVLRYCTKQKV